MLMCLFCAFYLSHLFFFFYYLFVCLFIWLCRVLVAACGIFHCGVQALRCGTRASFQLWCVGPRACRLSSCGVQGSRAHRFSCPVACGILVPQPGIEPVSPALEGGFLTTGPPGKSHVPPLLCFFFLFFFASFCIDW